VYLVGDDRLELPTLSV